MTDDATLLRRYAEERSEAAFAELVHRRIDLVYSAALRRTGDRHRAEEVAQQVFTTLAQQARSLCRHPALSAWLHTATRNAALNLVMADQRRKQREAEAVALETVQAAGELKWEALRPELDRAIDELPEPDRIAVVLRYLEHRAFAEIGAVLRVSEDAARMRAERALDKLRTSLARRGITSTAAALGALVSAEAIVAAPAGFATALIGQSLVTAGATVTGAAFFTFMNAKAITVATALALGGFLAGSYFAPRRTAPDATAAAQPSRKDPAVAALRDDNQRLNATLAGLNGDLLRLKAANADLTAKLAAADAKAAARPTKSATLGMARWEIQQAALNNLRQIDAARAQYALEHGYSAHSVEELVGRSKEAYIRRVQSVDGEIYSGLSMNLGDPLTVTTPEGISVTFDPKGDTTTKIDYPPEVARARQMGEQMTPAIQQATKAYRDANGKAPPNERALVPYFSSPKEGADYVELLEAKKAAGI